MLFQTLDIEADSGSRERSQRAELGEPPPRFAAAAVFRRRKIGPCPSLRGSPASTTGHGYRQPGDPPILPAVCPCTPHVTWPTPGECALSSFGPGLRPPPNISSSPARSSGMAAAKAEMQLMSPLQISDPFGSFPHSPTMDNYPKLEEMMLLSNGTPQFLGAAGTPEGSGGNSSSSNSSSGGGGGGGSNNGSSAFNPQGEPSEQPYEHLTTGKRWSAPKLKSLS